MESGQGSPAAAAAAGQAGRFGKLRLADSPPCPGLAAASGGLVEKQKDAILTMLQAPQDLAIRQDGIVTMRRIVYGFFAFSALTALSISFVDRPLALFVHAQLQGEPGIVQLALRTMT